MDELRVYDISAAPPELLDRLRRELAAIRTLEQVLVWARQCSPPSRVAEIVTQDEYTHDVVVALGDRYLAFDTT